LEHFPHERPLLQELAEARIGHDFLRNLMYRDPFFIKCKHPFINLLSDTFKFKRYHKHQYIYQYGNDADIDSIFFIAAGTAEVISPSGDTTLEILQEGSFYGQLDAVWNLREELERYKADNSQQHVGNGSQLTGFDTSTPVSNGNLSGTGDKSNGSGTGGLQRVDKSREISQQLPGTSTWSGRTFDFNNSVPMTSNLSSTLTTTTKSARRRDVSIRATSQHVSVFVLKKRDLVVLLLEPDFDMQLSVLEQSAFDAMEKERLKRRSVERTRKDGAPGDVSIGDGIDSLSSTHVQHSDAIDIAGSKKSSSRPGLLKKQMSAFLKSPLEAAKEIMKAKQRSANMSKKMEQAQSTTPKSAPGGTNLEDSGASPAPSSSSSLLTKASLQPSGIEETVVGAVLGTPDRIISQLSQEEAIRLLQAISSLQSAVSSRLSSPK